MVSYISRWYALSAARQARILLGGLVGLTFVGAKDLLACPVCGYVSEQSRQAFLLTTGIMTLVPLAIVGGVVYYIYRAATGPR